MGKNPHNKKKHLSVNNIRSNNKINILTNIVKSKDMIRNDLAIENGISLMTVKHIVDEFVNLGIVEEHTYDVSVGRKPKALNIASKYGNIICIDLTTIDTISYIVYDLKEKILFQDRIEFKESEKSYRDNLVEIMDIIQQEVESICTETVGIAVFVPSAYYEKTDLVNYDLISAFKNMHIKKMFYEKFHIDNILILHDVFAAAKSEYESSNPNTDSQFYLYSGSGIAGFFIHNGRAIMGNDLVAGEIGKMILEIDPETKKAIVLDEVGSISSIMSSIKNIRNIENIHEAMTLYNKDEEISKIIDRGLDCIAIALFNVIWLYNPTQLVVDSCNEDFCHLMKQRTEEYIANYMDGSIPINVIVREAEYDEYRMMRGCFRLVLEKWIDDMSKKTVEKAKKEEIV